MTNCASPATNEGSKPASPRDEALIRGLSEERQLALATNTEAWVVRRLAGNPSLTRAAALAITQGPDALARRILTWRPDLPLDILGCLVDDTDPWTAEVAVKAAKKRGIDTETLRGRAAGASAPDTSAPSPNQAPAVPSNAAKGNTTAICLASETQAPAPSPASPSKPTRPEGGSSQASASVKSALPEGAKEIFPGFVLF